MDSKGKSKEQPAKELVKMRERCAGLEKALLEKEEKNKFLYDESPGISLEIGTDLKIKDVSRLAVSKLGYSRNEIVGMEVFGYVVPKDRERVAEQLEGDFRGEYGSEFVVDIYARNGEVRTILFSPGQVILRDGDQSTGILVTGVDITSRIKVEEKLRRNYKKLQRILDGTVNALASVVEKRDPYTAGHQRRVSLLCCAIAGELGLPDEQIEGIRIASLLHDIGKLHVPAEILNKPVQLDEIEMKIVKTHPQVGYEILAEVEFSWPVSKIVLQHHERVKGYGYPHGLTGDDICLEGKILGVADVVEAMVSHRPYRPARSIDEALEEIIQNAGALYDPEVVSICVKLFREKKFQFE